MRSKRLLLGLLGVLVLALTGASPAFATNPEFGSSTGGATTSGGKGKLEQNGGLAPITCTSHEGKIKMNNIKEGEFEETFLGCTAPLSGKCTGLNDKVLGAILFKGTWKLGYIDAAKTKVGVAHKLNPEVHFECEKTIALGTVRGCVIGEIAPLNVFVKEFTLTFNLVAAGVNEFLEILNPANNAWEVCKLEMEINGGAFKQTGLEWALVWKFPVAEILRA